MVPDITIRSTFIVGFPGETRRGFRRAPRMAAGGAARPRRLLRIFAGRRAPRRTICGSRRFRRRSSASAGRDSWSSPRRSAPGAWPPRSAGTCRCWSIASRADVAIARSSSDAPEIDGTVRIRGAHELAVGDWAQVRITAAGAYDLEARVHDVGCPHRIAITGESIVEITADRVVTIHYTLKDDDGAVLDSSAGGEPLAYIQGHGNLVSGLERPWRASRTATPWPWWSRPPKVRHARRIADPARAEARTAGRRRHQEGHAVSGPYRRRHAAVHGDRRDRRHGDAGRQPSARGSDPAFRRRSRQRPRSDHAKNWSTATCTARAATTTSSPA